MQLGRDDSQGIDTVMGNLGIPRDSKGMIGALGITWDSKKGIIGNARKNPYEFLRNP